MKEVPVGKSSMLVKEAVGKEMDRVAALAIVRKMKGKVIWKRKHHPDLLTSKDFSRYRPLKSRRRR